MFGREDLAVTDFEQSIRHDVTLLPSSPAVPRNVKLVGFFYEINSHQLTEIVRDLPL